MRAADILLLGAGQLGSRYLQGLFDSPKPLNIIVIDPSPNSITTAKNRWKTAAPVCSQHQIQWANSIPMDCEEADLAIIATGAKHRAEIVEKASQELPVRYWVLEKLLAQSVDEVKTIKRATAMSEGAWVNTSRRMMIWHKSLKNRLQREGPIDVSYSAGLWGLACNSIHFIDLVAWWMDEKLESVDVSDLGSDWFESKRTGYFEVTGKLVAHFSKGSSLMLEAQDQAEIKPLQIDLPNGTAWKIDEVNGAAFSTTGDHIDGSLEYQSQLSGRLVDDILRQGQCDLPTLKESASMHAIFLKAMLEHWNLSQKRNDICVPIT